MSSAGDGNAFARYEEARARYDQLQADIQRFLAHFLGDSAVEGAFEVADLEAMDRLRAERDEAFDEYRIRERAVFEELGAPWQEDEPGKRFRLTRNP